MRKKNLTYRLPKVLIILTMILTCVADGRASAKYWVLHNLAGGSADGCFSYAGLVFDAVGDLYGTTISCGAYDYGTAFKLEVRTNWAEVILHSFDSDRNDGRDPWAGLIFDPVGSLYGTTGAGGLIGTIFELMPSSGGGWTESVLHSFDYLKGDGAQPFAGLVFDKAGDLYGTTRDGGPPGGGGGTVFELSPSSGSGGDWTETIIYGFTAKNDGSEPQAGLTWDGSGNLYSTTTFGGGYYQHCSPGCGTVFKLIPTSGGGWKEHILHRFNWAPGGPDGYAPYASVIFDNAGNLYGTTAAGGSSSGCFNGCGTVFKLTPLSNGRWKETILHSFHFDQDGYAPFAGLIMDKAGNFYGTTTWGGINNAGTVFKLARGSNGRWNYTVLHRFTGPDGAQSSAGLIFDKAGKHLYGTTTLGGKYNAGVVFEITP
jgi:uncharacterized repeat protein (TIGR03803 family)